MFNSHNMNKFVVLFLLGITFSLPSNATDTKKAQWVYHPGDFEIWLHKKMTFQRTERNQILVPAWRIDNPYTELRFFKRVSLDKPEKASIYVDGDFHIRVDNELLYDYNPQNITLPAGNYQIIVSIINQETLPSFLFESESVKSDETWTVKTYNGENIQVATYPSSSPDMPPSCFRLATTPMSSQVVESTGDYTLYDFGKNTFGFPVLEGIRGKGELFLYYGESREEAMAGKIAETWDILDIDTPVTYNDTLSTKAFRYVKVAHGKGVEVKNLSMLYEYLPVEYRGSFTSSDDLINRIYETSLYTFHLTARECHLDGIKRDRWIWSGDVLQSLWMNFYSFFDEDVNKRSIWGLRGHPPVSQHMNTILDYTFYWLIGVNDHYLYSGDDKFIHQIYPRVKETIDFAIVRLNKDGIAEGLSADWVFVDWAPIDKTGELSFEQLLFMRSLLSVKNCAKIVGDREMESRMQIIYDESIKKFDEIYWSSERGLFLHHRKNGELMDYVTRYTNMFAILFDMVDDERKELIKNNVILNPGILQITTPYMKFYELAALCEIGEQKQVLDFVREYWGGMLRLGATTFWEAYDPTLADDKHYEMYGRPFGKSLCHAWGANPIYLFGRYYLGVRPTKAGYKEYLIEPKLGGLEWMEGTVPTPSGDIQLHVSRRKITIKTPNSTGGVLRFNSDKKPKVSAGTLQLIEKDTYELKLDKMSTFFEIEI